MNVAAAPPRTRPVTSNDLPAADEAELFLPDGVAVNACTLVIVGAVTVTTALDALAAEAAETIDTEAAETEAMEATEAEEAETMAAASVYSAAEGVATQEEVAGI